MTTFKAFRIDRKEKQIIAGFQNIKLDDLTEGEVVIKVSWSGINYKDALAGTGKGQILRQYPLNGGIDLAGSVVSSLDSRYKEGDSVLVCGCGLSETADGGYAEYARVCGDCMVPIPNGMSEREAMGIGTAGFTAALAVMRMEQMGQTPDMGPMLVTGATGGVGSFAIDMLAANGYDITAFTGKTEQYDYLKNLGASDFIDRKTFEMSGRPLDKALWGGAVDSVGGETLAWLCSTVKPFGNIASIGLAGGYKLETTVMPFILRGVSLIGINSIEMPTEMRNRAWGRLGDDLRPKHLEEIITREITFDELPGAFDGYLNASILGRTVVKIA
jgi:acrylyl-CoA reductase (NADPH)